jgi:hypothetical protein
LGYLEPATKQRNDLLRATRIPQVCEEIAERLLSTGLIRQVANGLKEIAGQRTVSNLADDVSPVDVLLPRDGGTVPPPKRFNKGPGAWRAHKGLSV